MFKKIKHIISEIFFGKSLGNVTLSGAKSPSSSTLSGNNRHGFFASLRMTALKLLFTRLVTLSGAKSPGFVNSMKLNGLITTPRITNSGVWYLSPAGGGRGWKLICGLIACFRMTNHKFIFSGINKFKSKFNPKYIVIAALFMFSTIVINQGCVNPFAPGLAGIDSGDDILGDQKTIEGLFQNFRYSYLFKDTLVYGGLLNDDFRFIFRDFDKGVDESWGRDEDMRTTSGLFMATQNLDLNWNDVVNSVGDSLVQDISRGFNLTVIFSPTDVITIFGRVNLRITRQNSETVWRISQWRDESNF